MSQALKPLDAAQARSGETFPRRFKHPKFCLDDPAHLFTPTVLDMVTEPILFFSAANSRLVFVNRAAANCLGYSQQQLRCMSLLDITPQATGTNMTEIYRRAMRSANQEARVRTVCRHQSGSLVPVHCSIRALRPSPQSIFVAVGRGISAPGKMDPQGLSAAFRD